MRGSRANYTGMAYQALHRIAVQDYSYRTDHKKIIFVFDPSLEKITTIRGKKIKEMRISKRLTERLKEVCLEPMLLSKYSKAIDIILKEKRKKPAPEPEPITWQK